MGKNHQMPLKFHGIVKKLFTLSTSSFWAVVQNLGSQASKPTEKSGLKPMFIRGITLFFLMFFSCVFYHAYHAYHAPTIVVYGVNGHPLQIARELLFFLFSPLRISGGNYGPYL